jgi:two-component system nitrogen regulation response regulator GlnG
MSGMPEAGTLLIVDDEESICSALERFFSRRGWQVRSCSTLASGREIWRELGPDVVFLDVRLPDGSGLDLLEEACGSELSGAVVMITAYGDMETVLRGMRGKAFDHLPKPIDMDHAIRVARRALRAGRSSQDPRRRPEPSRPGLVGNSPVMQEIYKRIARLSAGDCSVLIEGPTGTGKELAARAIHAHSSRSDGPFEAVNCGALPASLVESELFGRARGSFTGAQSDAPGKFEAAQGGTLLLDEVGELPPEAQVKLLRVLDTHTIQRVGSTRSIELDVRVLAATNRDLETFVSEGGFRGDLYYRLAVGRLRMVPLARRKEDIPLLASHFLSALAEAPRLHADALARLEACDWPGNVRQLRNVLLQAAALSSGGWIHAEDLVGLSPAPAQGDADPDDLAGQLAASLSESEGDLYRRAVQPVEEAVIRRALQSCAGNQTDAARLLGLHRNTLRKKLRALEIDPDAL